MRHVHRWSNKPGTNLSILVCTASHRTELAPCSNVDSTNEQRHTLRTCSCAAQTRSDRCRPIKVSIILCVLSVDIFFSFSVASVAKGRICLPKNHLETLMASFEMVGISGEKTDSVIIVVLIFVSLFTNAKISGIFQSFPPKSKKRCLYQYLNFFDTANKFFFLFLHFRTFRKILIISNLNFYYLTYLLWKKVAEVLKKGKSF